MPYVSIYFAYVFLRIAQTLNIMRRRNGHTVASSTRFSVGALTGIVLMQAWFKTLRKARSLRDSDFGPGTAALSVCETSQALQCLELLVPKNSEEDHAAFLEKVGGGCRYALIRLLQS